MGNFEVNINWNADTELSDKVKDEPILKTEKKATNFNLKSSFQVDNYIPTYYKPKPDYDINLLRYSKNYKGKLIEEPVLYNQVDNSVLGFTYPFQDGDADVVFLNYSPIIVRTPGGPCYFPRDNVSLHEKDHGDHPYRNENQVRTYTRVGA